MSSNEETQKIVAESEKRIEDRFDAKLDALEKRFMDKIDASHTAVAGTVSDFGNDIKEVKNSMNNFINKINSWKNEHVHDDDVWKATHEAEHVGLGKDMKEVKDILRKIGWIVISGVVIALLGLVLK